MACKPRGAAPVQLVSGHLEGQVGFHGAQPANGRVFAAGIAVAEAPLRQLLSGSTPDLETASLTDQGPQVLGWDVPEGSRRTCRRVCVRG